MHFHDWQESARNFPLSAIFLQRFAACVVGTVAQAQPQGKPKQNLLFVENVSDVKRMISCCNAKLGPELFLASHQPRGAAIGAKSITVTHRHLTRSVVNKAQG